jgi:anthranilate synthase/indole-3-glycerol phosphate synthase/phosphoribosylanthranilate isomerase
MRVADAVAAASAGADFIGILFEPKSRRRVDPQEAAVIARAVGAPLREIEQDEPPPLHPNRAGGAKEWFWHGADALDRMLARKRPLVVGVFEDQPIEEVNEIADEAGIDLIQLSGNEPWDDCMLANRPVINAVHGAAAIDLAALAADGPIALMLDASRGTGALADLAAAADLAAQIPVWLAGGLSPDNVRAAIAAVHPWLVDVSTGVETGGAKDPARIAAFIDAVHGVTV